MMKATINKWFRKTIQVAEALDSALPGGPWQHHLPRQCQHLEKHTYRQTSIATSQCAAGH